MKIRTIEIKDEEIDEKGRKAAQALKEKGFKEFYAELDTGGEFDDLPEKLKENLKEKGGVALTWFISLLLTAMDLDILTKKQEGIEIIKDGLIAIEEKIRKALKDENIR